MSIDTSNGSNKKFEEALNLLNEAARDKKDEIQRLISDKYSNIKDMFEETVSMNRAKVERVRHLAEDAIERGQETLRETATDLDESVRRNPWAYIGGVAAGALLIGFIMGSSRRD
jgi:ElaB/YqjD/DUF883 family membrane-anchored ribosome-binding protein